MDKLVVLDTFFHLQQAHLVKALLESSGINCFLFDENVAALTPYTVGGIRLMVRETDLEKAKEIISSENNSSKV